MTDHHTEEEKPSPSGDDAVPDSDQVDSSPEEVGTGEDPEPAEEAPSNEPNR